MSHVQNTTAHQPNAFVYNWNTAFTGNKEGKVDFPQRKPLPRSTANFTVTVYTSVKN